jgi:acyl-CoA thioesterase-1
MIVAKKALFIALLAWIPQATSPKVVLFYGDSLTAGYGLSTDEAFPARASEVLSKKGKSVKVVNAGLSGETSAGGLARLDWVMRQPTVDVFVLELGANDGLRGLPIDQTRKNLQTIIDRVKGKYPNVKIVIAGMMVPPNMGEAYTAEFRKVFPELAQKNKATLIPFLLQDVAGIEKLNQGDGIHPNAEGHRIVGNTVATVLEKLL